jgi:anti-sigma factor RsiW
MESYLGAYLLDALEPDEAAAVQAHSAGCRRCRDELADLAGAVTQLAVLSRADAERVGCFEAEPALPVLSQGRRRAGRGRRPLLIGAGAVLATAIVAIGVRAASDGPGGTVVRAVDARTHVQAAVTLAARPWGTEVRLALRGVRPGGWCSLVAHGSGGQSDIAGTWDADRRGDADVPGATAIPVGRLRELDVVTQTGRELVHVVLPHDGRQAGRN